MANRRFEMYQYQQILTRMRLGDSDRDLARSRLIGRNKASLLRTIAGQNGWLDQNRPVPTDAELRAVFDPSPKSGAASSSLVLPFREQVLAWANEGLDGTTIHKALIRLYGFSGSYSSVRRFLQNEMEKSPNATVILDFDPAEAAQVDFGAGPRMVDMTTGEELKSWFFVMTLCYSRHQYAEFVFDQKVETWLACHRRAFAWFGGVPQKLIIDNPKCAITRACTKDPDVQRAYEEFVLGYGVRIAPCPPAEPKKKGRVEAGVKYVKRAFLPLRQFRNQADANRQLEEWVMGEAGNRTHGTTHRQPLALFAETEKVLLAPLPDVPVQVAVWASVKVHGNAHVAFEKNLYSVPFRLIRQTLWLKATDTTVQLFREHTLVAVHCRLRGIGHHATLDEHLPPNALAYKMRDPQWCLQQAAEIGPACWEIIEQLFADHVLEKLRAAQGVIRLGDRYGKARLEAACTRALFFGSPLYRTVKTILQRGEDQAKPADNNQELSAIYTGKGQFQRSSSELLQ
jgi:transposase